MAVGERGAGGRERVIRACRGMAGLGSGRTTPCHRVCVSFPPYLPAYQLHYPTLCRSLCACQNSSKMSISSCARPNANTGNRHRPPRRTILATSSVKL